MAVEIKLIGTILMKFLILVLILLTGLVKGCSTSSEPSEVSISLAIKYDMSSHQLSLVSVDEPNKDYDMGSHNQYYSLNDNSLIKLRQGDTFTINLTSDVEGGFHIHGYDFLNDVETEKPLSFTFVATATGKYDMVFHRFAGEGHQDHGNGEGHQDHGDIAKDDEHEDMEIVLGSIEVFPN